MIEATLDANIRDHLQLEEWRLAVVETAVLFEAWLARFLRARFETNGLPASDIDALLEREPRNIAALVAKGELRSAAGDGRSAAAFYKAALSAAQSAGQLPTSLKPAIDRALAGLAEAEQGFLRQLEHSLAQSGFPEGRRPPRFQRALDLMLGREQGLPRVSSGHNSYFLWGPQASGEVMIVLGSDEEDLRRTCPRLEKAGTASCDHCMPYEDDLPVWICRGVDLRNIWPQVKGYI